MTEKDRLLHDLAAQREALLRAVEGLSSGQLQQPGAAGPTWSVQDVLGHVAAWERETVEAIRAYQAGSAPYRIAGFEGLADRDRWNQDAVAQRRNWPVHETLLELEVVRNELLGLLADLSEAQLGEWIAYPWGKRGLLSKLLDFGADHEREHAASLAAWRRTL